MNTPTLRSSTAMGKALEGSACRSLRRKILIRAPALRSCRLCSECRFQERLRKRARTQAYRETGSPEAFRKARARNLATQSAPRGVAVESVVQGRADPQGEDSRA